MLKLRQPPAIKPLVFTQGLERVGGVLLLILIATFLSRIYHLDDQQTINLAGAYGALSMAGYLVGGLLSDRFLGYRRCIRWGIFLLFAGYLLLTVKSLVYLYVSLSLICVGNSLFMPSLSGFVSDFFYERDPRRSRAFIWLYLGMNVGALVAAIVADLGLLVYGWQLAFYFCACIMVIAGCVFIVSQRNYENRGLAPRDALIQNSVLRLLSSILITLCLLGAVFILLQNLTSKTVILYILSILVLAAMLIASFYEADEKRYRLIRIIIIIVFSVIFWGLCSQIYLVVPLFINREVGMNYSHIQVAAPIYFALNALLVAIFCPILASFWRRLYTKRAEPAPGTKIALALLSVGVAMTILTLGSIYPGSDQHVHAVWVLAAFVFFALGESILYPTGLSLTTLLAPKSGAAY